MLKRARIGEISALLQAGIAQYINSLGACPVVRRVEGRPAALAGSAVSGLAGFLLELAAVDA